MKDWQTSGLIVTEGKTIAVTIPSPLLVFDVDSWSEASKKFFESEAQSLSSRGDEEGALDLLRLSTALGTWLERRVESVDIPPIAFRQKIAPSQIDATNIKSYIVKVASLGRQPDPTDECEFVLNLDGVPTLYALGTLKSQLRHTGNSILGVPVTKSELYDLVEKNLKGSARKLIHNAYAKCGR